MDKLRTVLKPELTKLILGHCPVAKKRSALWFFTNELNKKWCEQQECNGSIKVKRNSDSSFSELFKNLNMESSGRKLKRSLINEIWKAMDPEAKRKYFNMAEFDEVRLKEQRSLIVAQLGSLLAKNQSNEILKVTQSMGNSENDSAHFIESLEKFKENYDRMIQTESTKMLYKSVLERTSSKFSTNVNTEKMISAVPENLRPILSRPRRPPSPFVLFALQNKERLTSKTKLDDHNYFLKSAGLEWSTLSLEEKAPFQSKYSSLMEEYNKEMERFKVDNMGSTDCYLEQASREKRAFRKSLRKRLREFAVVPVNVRNAFNFFIMENRGQPLSQLTQAWRELPESEKLKYKQLNQDDAIRYYNEKIIYDELMKKMHDVFIKKSLKGAD